jgi:hypothetical protein
MHACVSTQMCVHLYVHVHNHVHVKPGGHPAAATVCTHFFGCIHHPTFHGNNNPPTPIPACDSTWQRKAVGHLMESI